MLILKELSILNTSTTIYRCLSRQKSTHTHDVIKSVRYTTPHRNIHCNNAFGNDSNNNNTVSYVVKCSPLIYVYKDDKDLYEE